MGGKPCIRGMRVTVGMIVGQIGAGHSIEEVLAEYPYLEREDMLQALRYAAYRRTGRTPVQRDHLGNGPARTGPERTGAHTCLQWAHCTSRGPALLAPEWASTATELFLWQCGHVRSTRTLSGAGSVFR